jgi:hypothetical protein
MSRIDELAAQYADHITVPWQQGLPAANRVVMLVYEKELERHLRAKLLEFEQATKAAGHGWWHCWGPGACLASCGSRM